MGNATVHIYPTCVLSRILWYQARKNSEHYQASSSSQTQSSYSITTSTWKTTKAIVRPTVQWTYIVILSLNQTIQHSKECNEAVSMAAKRLTELRGVLILVKPKHIRTKKNQRQRKLEHPSITCQLKVWEAVGTYQANQAQNKGRRRVIEEVPHKLPQRRDLIRANLQTRTAHLGGYQRRHQAPRL